MPASATSTNGRHVLLALVLGLCLAAILFEVGCQLAARLWIFPDWDETLADDRHFYRHSDSEILAYELKPNTLIQKPDRVLRINAHGIRDDSDDVYATQRRIAIAGDSVVFGFLQSQAATISGKVQERLDPTAEAIKVFNFGIGGLNLEEVTEFIRRSDAVYDVDDVIFLLNPNDFAPRDSIYEGADNGLYRMHERPSWMSRWFVRKAIYRLHKSDADLIGWYDWMFEGNEEWGYEQLREMARYAREAGIELSVVVLPSAFAFSDDGYKLAHYQNNLRGFFEAEGIRYADPVERFQAHRDEFYDDTDHLHDPGNDEMARVMIELLERHGDPVVAAER